MSSTDAEIRGEMATAADAFDAIDEVFADLLGELLQVLGSERAKVGGSIDPVEQRSAHGLPPFAEGQ